MESNLLKLRVQAENNNSEYVFFNAWNECSESDYLDPDTINGYDYLNIIKNVFK